MGDRRMANTMGYSVLLSCGHSFLYVSPLPKAGEAVSCRDCKRDVVVEVTMESYSGNCTHCSYTRQHRRDYEKAIAQARQHLVVRPGHRVNIYNGLRLVESVRVNPDDQRERKETVQTVREVGKENQRMLRDSLRNPGQLP
jgi:hypothetical protein